MRRAILLLPLLALTACGGGSGGGAQPPSATRSGAARAAPAAPAADLRTQAEGDDRFAGRLYATLAGGGQTFAFSPFSISQAMAMTSAGARGQTLAQLEQAMSFALPQDRLHAALNALDATLTGRAGPGVELDVADSLWGQNGERFSPPFLDTLARDYGAAMQLVDYRSNSDGAAQRIDAWVAARTRDKIPTLIAPGVLDRNTRLVLVNAVYLNADWETPFDAGMTGEQSFHAPGGDVTAKFMHREGQIAYARGDGYEAVELPYRGRKLAMDLILPGAGRLAAVESTLARGGVGPLLGGLKPTLVSLGLPKLDLTSHFDLTGALAKLGARDIFTDIADLSGMTTQERLTLTHVIHEVKLKVDEKGTEAAAATGAVAGATSAMVPPPIDVTFDRPFILAVRDRPTGEVLFLARVQRP